MGEIYALSDGDMCCGEKIKEIGSGGLGAILQGVVRKGLTEKVMFEPRLKRESCASWFARLFWLLVSEMVTCLFTVVFEFVNETLHIIRMSLTVLEVASLSEAEVSLCVTWR